MPALFFNFTIERSHLSISNPCNDLILSKTFRAPRMKEREIIAGEVVDEVIYRCRSSRARLMLELQARCGLRIGEVLQLRASDLKGRMLTIRRPKSGRDEESGFLPEALATRLKTYIEAHAILSGQRIFPIPYPRRPDPSLKTSEKRSTSRYGPMTCSVIQLRTRAGIGFPLKSSPR